MKPARVPQELHLKIGNRGPMRHGGRSAFSVLPGPFPVVVRIHAMYRVRAEREFHLIAPTKKVKATGDGLYPSGGWGQVRNPSSKLSVETNGKTRHKRGLGCYSARGAGWKTASRRSGAVALGSRVKNISNRLPGIRAEQTTVARASAVNPRPRFLHRTIR